MRYLHWKHSNIGCKLIRNQVALVLLFMKQWFIGFEIIFTVFTTVEQINLK